MKRLVLVLALAASALAGSVATSVASTPSRETLIRAALGNCVLMEAAGRYGVSRRQIPLTVAGCYMIGSVR